jgi:hypothetical protein
MKLIRSWPNHALPAGRNYVVDDARRVLTDGCDYRTLVEVDDDLIQLDWDTAVSREDLLTFAALAREHPERVLVAPVPVYPDSRRGLPGTVWNLRRYAFDHFQLRYVYTGEPTCHLFGFGMVYLPRKLIHGFAETFRTDLDEGRIRFDDTGFAGWHCRQVQRETPIAWQVRPVHLHYRIGEVPL